MVVGPENGDPVGDLNREEQAGDRVASRFDSWVEKGAGGGKLGAAFKDDQAVLKLLHLEDFPLETTVAERGKEVAREGFALDPGEAGRE